MLNPKGINLEMKGVNYKDCCNLKEVFDNLVFYNNDESEIINISEDMPTTDLIAQIGLDSYNKNLDLTFEEFTQSLCNKIVRIFGNADYQIRELSCANLTGLHTFDLKCANVTTASYLFFACSSLTKVTELNTQDARDMISMFAGCKSLVEVPLFDTKNVVNMEAMFGQCCSLKTVPEFNTRKVKNMSKMFHSCTSLESVPRFTTNGVLDMYKMFFNCSSLKSIPDFNTQEVTCMEDMFNGCVSLEDVPELDTSSVVNANYTFKNCKSLKSKLKFKATEWADVIVSSLDSKTFDNDKTDFDLLNVITMIGTYDGTKFEKKTDE